MRLADLRMQTILRYVMRNTKNPYYIHISIFHVYAFYFLFCVHFAILLIRLYFEFCVIHIQHILNVNCIEKTLYISQRPLSDLHIILKLLVCLLVSQELCLFGGKKILCKIFVVASLLIFLFYRTECFLCGAILLCFSRHKHIYNTNFV